MNEMTQINEVINLLSSWVNKINLSSAIDFYDINKVSENLAANLLNEIYGYQLINLNIERRNFPAVDLGETNNSNDDKVDFQITNDVAKISFQVTSTMSKEKIESTLEKFVNHNLQSRFTDGVRFLFLTTEKAIKLTDANKKKYQGIYSNFDENHLLTLQNLIQEIQVLYNKDNERFYRVLKILERELSPQSNNYGIPLEQLIELAKKLGIAEKERDDWMQKYRDLQMQLSSRHDDVAKQAKELLDEGKLEEAKNLIKQSFANKLNLLKEAATEAFSIAQIANLQYNTTEAINYYQQGLKLDPDNADGWNRLAALYLQIGELDQAINAWQTLLKLGQAHQDQQEQAMAYGNLGIVYSTSGELDKAVEMFNKALAINQEVGSKKGMAANYGNLGIVYDTRGELDKAVEMHNKASEIDEQMGNKLGMAANYSNLGIIYDTRGDLDKAVEMYNKGLEIQIVLGDKQGMAANYGNLGSVYKTRGKLDKAVEMYNKGLEIQIVLGDKQGMAANYGNLGIVYKTHGELDKAVEMHNKALKLNQALGIKSAMADNYGNLGNVYKTRGDLDKAVEMYQKILKIHEDLGSKEGLAADYGNLGNVYKLKGNKTEAKRYYQKAIELFKYIGSPNAAKVQKWLDNLK